MPDKLLLAGLLLAVKVALPPGATYGPNFEVYKVKGDEEVTWRVESSVWFNHRSDWTRFVWKTCKAKGMTKEGALLALAHARIAGGHWLSPKKCRGPMRAFNLWGITAGEKYRKSGKTYYKKGKPWRAYQTPSHGVGGWLYVLRNYPDAKNQLYETEPNVSVYVIGLCNGNDGRKYMKCPSEGRKAYVKNWIYRLEAIMDTARADLQQQGFSI